MLEAEHMLCNNYWANQRKMDISQIDLQEYSGFNHFMVGILLNGVPLLSSLSYIAFYDALQSSTSSRTNAIQLDNCLGGYTTNGFYHYYSYSPCIFETSYKSALTTPSSCNSIAACKTNPLTFANTQTPADFKKKNVIGIAKDGHTILGPFKDDGSLWQPCEVDACNGFTEDGKYQYVLTSFYPYSIGCWGPATKTSYSLTCTTNERVCATSNLRYSNAFKIDNQLANIILSTIYILSAIFTLHKYF